MRRDLRSPRALVSLASTSTTASSTTNPLARARSPASRSFARASRPPRVLGRPGVQTASSSTSHPRVSRLASRVAHPYLRAPPASESRARRSVLDVHSRRAHAHDDDGRANVWRLASRRRPDRHSFLHLNPRGGYERVTNRQCVPHGVFIATPDGPENDDIDRFQRITVRAIGRPRPSRFTWMDRYARRRATTTGVTRDATTTTTTTRTMRTMRTMRRPNARHRG